MSKAKDMVNGSNKSSGVLEQEAEINEVDGEPIFHADEEEGDDHA